MSKTLRPVLARRLRDAPPARQAGLHYDEALQVSIMDDGRRLFATKDDDDDDDDDDDGVRTFADRDEVKPHQLTETLTEARRDRDAPVRTSLQYVVETDTSTKAGRDTDRPSVFTAKHATLATDDSATGATYF
jgi:hypothetical protein